MCVWGSSCPGRRGAAHSGGDGRAAAAEHGLRVPVSPGGSQKVRNERQSTCEPAGTSAGRKERRASLRRLLVMSQIVSHSGAQHLSSSHYVIVAATNDSFHCQLICRLYSPITVWSTKCHRIINQQSKSQR